MQLVRRIVGPCLLVMASLVSGIAVISDVNADAVTDQQQKIEQIAAQLNDLNERIAQIDEQYGAAQAEKDALDAEIAAAQKELATEQAQLDELQGVLTDIAVQKFVGNNTSELSPLFSSAAVYSDGQQKNALSNVAFDTGAASADEVQSLVRSVDQKTTELVHKQQRQVALMENLQQQKSQGEELVAQYTQKSAEANAKYGELVIQRELERQQEAAADAAAERAAEQAAKEATQQPPSQQTAPRAPSRGNGNATSNSNVSGNGSANDGGSNGAASTSIPTATTSPKPSGQPSNGAGSSSGGNGGGSSSAGSSNGGATSATAAPPPPTTTSGSNGGTNPGLPVPPPSGRAGLAIKAAYSVLGTPYVAFANDPSVGFDCSGLTQWAWAQAGVSLPHYSQAQYRGYPHVPRSQIQPGDLVFYYSPISHVGLYVGGGMMIDSPHTGATVRLKAVRWSAVVGISRPG